MATADELLAMTGAVGEAEDTSEQILIVNPHTRVISIPASITCIGVESDDDVNCLHFAMPRYYCGFDLSEFVIRVNFQNANGEGDIYDVVDKTISEDGQLLTFSWLVDRIAFKRRGDVTFSLCLKLYDTYGEVLKEWNTTVAELPVLKGLETEDTIIEYNASVLDRLFLRLYAVEAATGAGKDAYYNVIKMEEHESGALFSIVNQDGTVEAVVKHGRDGHTPKKGVDYFTESELNDVKNQAAVYAKSYAQSWAPFTTKVTLTVAGWSNKSQTVNANGVKADSIIFVSPTSTATDYTNYNNAKIICSGQSDGTLTFTCTTVPTAAITVDVVVFYSSDKFPLTYPYSDKTKTTNGITFTDNGDGTVTANGTATANAYFNCRNTLSNFMLSAGKYRLTGCPSGGVDGGYNIVLSNSEVGASFSDNGNGCIFTIDFAQRRNVTIQIKSGYKVSNLKFAPNIEKLNVGTFTVIDDGEGNITIV